MKMCADISRAYSEIFHDIRPLCTVVGTSALNRPTQFVEIMMEAVRFVQEVKIQIVQDTSVFRVKKVL